MREVNLAGVDLNLLPALEALLRRRNVTHAAADVGMSQPAMSRALGRLRGLLDDALLVRTSGGFALTPRAREIETRLAKALGGVRSVFHEPVFDPRVVSRTIRIACTDHQSIVLAPPIMNRLISEAPGLDLRMIPYPADLVARIESGDVDFAFALSTTPLPPGAASELIARDELALVMRRAHPAARKRWTLADYGRHPHVSVSIFGDGVSEIDTMLAAANVTRRIALMTPQFFTALQTVSMTDLVTTVSRSFAERFADQLDLLVRDPPFDATSLDLTLVWSGVRDSDPLLVWLRSVIRDTAQAIYQTRRPARAKSRVQTDA